MGLDAQDVPDADVLRFIDDILGSRQQDDGGSDKRIVQRVQAAVPILFRPVGGQEAHLGFSADLSLGGLAVGSEYVPKTGQELEMVLYVPEGAGLRPVRCQGRVVWASDEGGPEDVPAGFGVRFTVLGPEASEALRRIVVKAEQEDERS